MLIQKLYKASIFIFSVLLYSNVFAASSHYYISFSSENYNASVPALKVENDWEKGFQNGDVLFSHSQFRIARSLNKAEFGFVSRLDGAYLYSEDAAILKHQKDSHVAPEEERIYEVRIKGQHAASNGFFISIPFNLNPDFKLTSTIYLLSGNDLSFGNAKGNLNGGLNEIKSAELDLEYFYSEDKLLYRSVNKPEGFGLNYDFKADIIFSESSFAKIEVKDLYYRMMWVDSPKTIARLDTDVVNIDEMGHYHLRPLVSGVESYQNYYQSFQPRIYSELSIQYADVWVLASWDYVHEQHFPSLGFRLVYASYEIITQIGILDKSLGLSYLGSKVELGAKLDNLPESAYRLNISFSYKL